MRRPPKGWASTISSRPTTCSASIPTKIAPGQRGTNATAYHDPFVLFGFLAGVTKKIGFAAGVLILAQRQAALVAKQAACLDALCEGRFRLGVGVGWNEVEFQGLGMDFHTRGVRSEEQVRFMQALWAKEPASPSRASIHELTDGGINPRPKSGKVPVWFGGHAEADAEAAWRSTATASCPTAGRRATRRSKVFERLRGMIKEAGRQARGCRLEVWHVTGQGHASTTGASEITLLEEGRALARHVLAHS